MLIFYKLSLAIYVSIIFCTFVPYFWKKESTTINEPSGYPQEAIYRGDREGQAKLEKRKKYIINFIIIILLICLFLLTLDKTHPESGRV